MRIKMLRPVDRGVISSRCDAATFHFSSPARARRAAHCSSNCLRKKYACFPVYIIIFTIVLLAENTGDLVERLDRSLLL